MRSIYAFHQKGEQLTRILAFSPYAVWRVHANYETTITRACQLRGGEIKHILCDEVFAECDISSEASGRSSELCHWCQTGAKAAMEDAGLPYDWLSRYLEPNDQKEVFAWAQELRPEDFSSACYRGFPVGDCVRSSVVSRFRSFPIRMDDWQTVSVYRGFLHGAALAYIGLERALEEWKPDAIVLFNGRFSMIRVALTLAKQHSLRVLIHEAPRRPGTVYLVENDHVANPRPVTRFLKEWTEVPLTTEQLEQVAGLLRERRYGHNAPGMIQFATAPNGAGKVRENLGLKSGRTLIALFSTSTDEAAGDFDLHCPFPSQEVWIEKVVDWISNKPDCDMVIRVHPCLSGKSGIPRADSQIEWFKALRLHLPPNVTLVMPDDSLSSYDLMDVADLGVTYGSTAGAEMFALGKPMVSVLGYPTYESVPGIGLIMNAEELNDILDKALTLRPSREFRRHAFRYLYRYYFHMQLPFPLVTMTAAFESKLNYQTSEDLVPGKDSTLDSICGYLLEGKSIFASPDAKQSLLNTADEDAFFDKLEADPSWLSVRQSEIDTLRESTARKAQGTIKLLLHLSLRIIKATIPIKLRSRIGQALQ